MSNDSSNCYQTQDEGLNDNLQFMRSVVERADRQVRPEGYVLTACGLICLTCYTAVHFLLKSEQQKQEQQEFGNVKSLKNA